jgi:hypothetical protein
MPKTAAAALTALLLAAAPATAQPAQDRPVGDERESLLLICWGEGKKPTSTVSPGYAWNSDSNKFVPKTYVHSSTQKFDSEVQVAFEGDEGRIHLPKKLIPSTNSGGSNGWWPLSDIRMTPETIKAHYRMNSMNKPKVEIDRRSGRIKIDGIEKFKGECDQGDWAKGGMRF